MQDRTSASLSLKMAAAENTDAGTGTRLWYNGIDIDVSRARKPWKIGDG